MGIQKNLEQVLIALRSLIRIGQDGQWSEGVGHAAQSTRRLVEAELRRFQLVKEREELGEEPPGGFYDLSQPQNGEYLHWLKRVEGELSKFDSPTINPFWNMESSGWMPKHIPTCESRVYASKALGEIVGQLESVKPLMRGRIGSPKRRQGAPPIRIEDDVYEALEEAGFPVDLASIRRVILAVSPSSTEPYFKSIQRLIKVRREEGLDIQSGE